MKIILGSSSPRRRHILGIIYHNSFEIAHPDIDETLLPDELPESYCLRMAEEKSRACSSLTKENTVIICADTIVTMNGKIFGKPADHNQAVSFLTQLQGRTHSVITGIAICFQLNTLRIIKSSCSTEVTFRDLTPHGIEEYLSSINYLDKAGSYAIQENGSSIIRGIEGSLSNVTGFPVSTYFSLLRNSGLFDSIYP